LFAKKLGFWRTILEDRENAWPVDAVFSLLGVVVSFTGNGYQFNVAQFLGVAK